MTTDIIPPQTSRFRWAPALTVLVLAPFFGEALSGSTPPLDLLLPWNLAFMAGLYGCGALLCREVARRAGLGFLGLCLLGAAYGVFEEGLVDRYWFYPKFWDDAGVGDYGVVWGANVLLALHLTAFHTAVSVASSVLVVERLYPAYRSRAWAGRWVLVLAGVILIVVIPFLYGELDRGPGPVALVLTALLMAGLVALAFLARRLPPRSAGAARRRRGVGLIAFACTASHFVSVYAIPSSGLPWPVGVAISMVPIAVGVVVIPPMVRGGPYGRDGFRVVQGVLAFFVLLDVFVGLAGRYDLVAGGLLVAVALRWLGTRWPPEPFAG